MIFIILAWFVVILKFLFYDKLLACEFLTNIYFSFHRAALAIFSSVMKVKNCCRGNNKYFFSRGENYFNWGRKWTTRTWRHFPLVFFSLAAFLVFSFSTCVFPWSCHECDAHTTLFLSVRLCLQFKLHFERNFFTFKHSFSFGFFSCAFPFFFGQVG